MRHLIWFLLILLIVFRYFVTRPSYGDGDRVKISATVLTEPVRYETSQYLKVAGLKIYLPLFPEVSYGDRVVVEGVVDGKKLEDAKLQSLEKSENAVFNIKQRLTSFYKKSLPEPHAGLIGGITLGSKGGLSPDFWEEVKKTGVAHVVVASGMNVTFVASFLIGTLALFLPRRKSIPFVILGIILYLFISGFEAPLVRAAIMGIVTFWAQEAGRLTTAWRALVISALTMLVINPLWVGDLGFILSFVATASLLVFEKGIRRKLEFLPPVAKEGLSTSLSAQIGVAPILFVTFGQFSIWSPIVNALILWTVPPVMVIASISGLIGLIFAPLGKIVLYLAYPLTWWFVKIVEFF